MNRLYQSEGRLINLADDANLRREILLCQRAIYERYKDGDTQAINKCRLVMSEMEALYAEKAPMRTMWITDLVKRIHEILSIKSADSQNIFPRYVNLGRLSAVSNPHLDYHEAHQISDKVALSSSSYPISYNGLLDGVSVRVVEYEAPPQSAVVGAIAAYAIGFPMIMGVTFGALIGRNIGRGEPQIRIIEVDAGNTDDRKKLPLVDALKISRSIFHSFELGGETSNSQYDKGEKYVRLLKEIGELRVEPTSAIAEDIQERYEDTDLIEESEWTRSAFRKYFFGHDFGKPIRPTSVKVLCSRIVLSPEKKRELVLKMKKMKSRRSNLNRVFRGDI